MQLLLIVLIFAIVGIAGYSVFSSFAPRFGDVGVTLDSEVSSVVVSQPIQVTLPHKNALVRSPFAIEGTAAGQWFNDDVFTIELYDGAGTKIGTALGIAQGDTLSKSRVPFVASMYFEDPGTETGSLRFLRKNPSGLSEYEQELIVPIRLK